jgi:hypothetical protein
MTMRVVAMSYVLVAAAVLAGAAAAQNNPDPASRQSGGAQTTGQTDGTAGQSGGVREAPVGHRQPRAKDVPGPNESAPIRSPEEQEVDRKLRICRDC